MESNDCLTEREISDAADRLIKTAEKYAQIWVYNYKGVVDFDSILSDATLAMIHALRSYRRSGGASIENWVRRAMFCACRSSAKIMFAKRIRQHHEIDEGINTRFDADKGLIAGQDKDPVENNEREWVAQRISGLAMAQLNNGDREFFRRKWIEQKTDAEIGREVGITTAGAYARGLNVINRVRKLIVNIPEFMDYDHRGEVRAIADRAPDKGPQYRRVEQNGLHSYRWV
jgi:DNA-directed RNA polymerase specialized sigma24 family protein